jgi:hypothetical protein
MQRDAECRPPFTVALKPASFTRGRCFYPRPSDVDTRAVGMGMGRARSRPAAMETVSRSNTAGLARAAGIPAARPPVGRPIGELHECERAVAGSSEDTRVAERAEYCLAPRPIEIPELLRLRNGQSKTGHLAILSCDTLHQVVELVWSDGFKYGVHGYLRNERLQQVRCQSRRHAGRRHRAVRSRMNGKTSRAVGNNRRRSCASDDLSGPPV